MSSGETPAGFGPVILSMPEIPLQVPALPVESPSSIQQGVGAAHPLHRAIDIYHRAGLAFDHIKHTALEVIAGVAERLPESRSGRVAVAAGGVAILGASAALTALYGVHPHGFGVAITPPQLPPTPQRTHREASAGSTREASRRQAAAAWLGKHASATLDVFRHAESNTRSALQRAAAATGVVAILAAGMADSGATYHAPGAPRVTTSADVPTHSWRPTAPAQPARADTSASNYTIITLGEYVPGSAGKGTLTGIALHELQREGVVAPTQTQIDQGAYIIAQENHISWKASVLRALKPTQKLHVFKKLARLVKAGRVSSVS